MDRATREPFKVLRRALLLTGVVIGYVIWANVPAFAAPRPAGLIFTGQEVSGEAERIWGAHANGTSSFPIRSVETSTGDKLQYPALSPDGTSIAVAYRNNIGIVNTENGELTPVYKGPTTNNPHAGPPQWSPDGQRLVFVADVSSASFEAVRGHLYVVRTDGKELTKLTPAMPKVDTRYESPSFSPDGKTIVFATSSDQAKSGRLMTCAADGSNSSSIYFDPGGATAISTLQEPRFSPDGSQVYFQGKGQPLEEAVHRIPAEGGNDLQLTNEIRDPGGNYDSTWLPGGSKIVWVNDDYRGNGDHLKVMDADGEHAEQFLTNFYSASDPSFRQSTAEEASEAEALLEAYKPNLAPDSQESYLAASPAEMLESWGDEANGLHEVGEEPFTNLLWDADGSEVPESGTEIGRSSPQLTGAQFQLSLSSLGKTYPTGLAADENDWLDERNGHFAEDAARLQELPAYSNRIYGHAVRDLSGELWLQYWFYYYYDDLEVLGIGEHEGDWEMAEIGLSNSNVPVEYVLAEHKRSVKCTPAEILPNEGEGPLTLYPALGSHATLPSEGTFSTEVSGQSDHDNGLGKYVEPQVEVIGDGRPAWVDWPGHWGNSRGGGLDQASPTGPEAHAQWSDPSAFASTAAECFAYKDEELSPSQSKTDGMQRESQPAPQIARAAVRRGRVEAEYVLETGANRELLFSVTSSAGSPVVTKGVADPPIRGTVSMALPDLPAGQSPIVLISAVRPDGSRTSVTEYVP